MLANARHCHTHSSCDIVAQFRRPFIMSSRKRRAHDSAEQDAPDGHDEPPAKRQRTIKEYFAAAVAMVGAVAVVSVAATPAPLKTAAALPASPVERDPDQKTRFPKFQLPSHIRRWSDPLAAPFLSDCMEARGMRLVLEQCLPQRAWRCKTKVALQCTVCKIINDTTCINNLQNGGSMSCMCNNPTLKARWYYDTAIRNKFTDRDGVVWYSKLHDGTIAPVSWEDWCQAMSHKERTDQRVKLTCNNCGVTHAETCIHSLQGKSQGMSCMCSQPRLATKWYYNTCIRNKFIDRSDRVWYPRLHDGTIAPVSWEDWYQAASQRKRDNQCLKLTCTGCKVTHADTCTSQLQSGNGMSCMCSNPTLVAKWYYNTCIRNKFIDQSDGVWYPRLHDGTIAPVSWGDWYQAASQKPQNAQRLKLTCTSCKVTHADTWISNLQGRNGSMSCMCTRPTLTARWYYDTAIRNKFSDRNGVIWYRCLHGGTIAPVSWEDWYEAASQDDRDDKRLKLTCNVCKTTHANTRINHLQKGSGMLCACTGRKSQLKAFQWLCNAFPTPGPWLQEMRDCMGTNGKALPFDIACRARRVLVEVDGDQHFEADGHYVKTASALEQRAQVDLYKERWAVQHGWTVIRLYWADVYDDRYDWQGYLRRAIETPAPPRVVVPDDPHYHGGIYHRLRQPG